MESLSRCLTWTCCFHIRIRFCWVRTGQPCSVWSHCGKVEELLTVGVGLSHLCYVSVILFGKLIVWYVQLCQSNRLKRLLLLTVGMDELSGLCWVSVSLVLVVFFAVRTVE